MKLDVLSDQRFLDELHHLLWVDGYERDGIWDEGWNCRQHALIGGAVACVMGHRGAMIYGRTTFVQGSLGDLPPLSLNASRHVWFAVDGAGYFDLSPRLTVCRDPQWRPWVLNGVFGSQCRPAGDLHMAGNQRDFDNAVASATWKNGRNTAVYLGSEYADFSRKLFNEAFEAASSRLTDRLEQCYEPSIYAKAAVHLFRLLRGQAASLRHRSQDEAWHEINKQLGSAIDWICMKGRLR